MVVEADNALDGTGEHLVFRIDAGGLVQQFDLEPFILEVAEALGELGGQIDLLLIAAHHDGDLVGREHGAGPGQQGCKSERCRENTGAHGPGSLVRFPRAPQLLFVVERIA